VKAVEPSLTSRPDAAREPFAITHLEDSLVNLIRQMYTFIGWPGVVILMAIESAAIPLPSEIIMPLAGWILIRNAGLPLWWLLVAALLGAIGNTLGSWLTYWVGAAGGRPLLERYGRFLLITHHDLNTADAWFSRFGVIAVFAGRLLPVVRTFISIPAGVARMQFGMFTLLTFAGSFIWSLLLAWAGYVLGTNYERVRSVMQPFDVPIGLAILLLAALYVYRHLRRSSDETGGPGVAH
jgi:membrane protein DedA with SNARE-associated domain